MWWRGPLVAAQIPALAPSQIDAVELAAVEREPGDPAAFRAINSTPRLELAR